MQQGSTEQIVWFAHLYLPSHTLSACQDVGVTASDNVTKYLWGGLNSAQEQRHKPGQAVLVHGVHTSQVSNAEEEQAGSDSHRTVLLPGSINLLLCAFSFFNFAGYVVAGSLQSKERDPECMLR